MSWRYQTHLNLIHVRSFTFEMILFTSGDSSIHKELGTLNILFKRETLNDLHTWPSFPTFTFFAIRRSTLLEKRVILVIPRLNLGETRFNSKGMDVSCI